MEITPYVTTGAIRAALGVTENEVGDEALAEQMLDVALLADLSSLAPEHEAIFDEAQAEGASEQTRQRARLMTLFCLWHCVANVADSWLAFPNRISDGKSEMARSLDVKTLREISERAASRRDGWRARFIEFETSISQGTPQSTVPGLVSISVPGYDPVTDS